MGSFAHMRYLLIFIAVFLFSSCGFLQRDRMLRTPDNYVFDELPKHEIKEYRLAKDDRINIEIHSNNGYKALDITSGGGGRGSKIQVKVEFDGFINLPIL